MGVIQSSVNNMLGIAALAGGFARSNRAKSEATQIENVKKDIEQARAFNIPEAEIEKSIVSQLPEASATSLPETTRAAEQARSDFRREFQKNDPYGYYDNGITEELRRREEESWEATAATAQSLREQADNSIMEKINSTDATRERTQAHFEAVKNKSYADRQQLTIPQVKTKAPTRKQASRNMQLSKSAQQKQWDEISRMMKKENK